jgi:hypothetical protein
MGTMSEQCRNNGLGNNGQKWAIMGKNGQKWAKMGNNGQWAVMQGALKKK